MIISRGSLLAVAVAALMAAGCSSSRFSSIDSQPEPLTPAPAGTVNKLPPPAAPGAAHAAAGDDRRRRAAAAAASEPPVNASDVTAANVAGVWNATVSGQSCKIATPQTKFGAGFRAGPLHCPAPLDGVKSWNVAGKQLTLYDEAAGSRPPLFDGRRALRRPDLQRRAHFAQPLRPARLRRLTQVRPCICVTACRPIPAAQRYDHLVARGEVTAIRRRSGWPRARPADRRHLRQALSAKSSSLGWLFAKRREAAPVRGLYIHGGVGRGKTMLMDMFFELVPVRRKRRVHFNDFMADVHDRIGRHRQAVKRGEARGDDPIPPVAQAIADEAGCCASTSSR